MHKHKPPNERPNERTNERTCWKLTMSNIVPPSNRVCVIQLKTGATATPAANTSELRLSACNVLRPPVRATMFWPCTAPNDNRARQHAIPPRTSQTQQKHTVGQSVDCQLAGIHVGLFGKPPRRTHNIEVLGGVDPPASVRVRVFAPCAAVYKDVDTLNRIRHNQANNQTANKSKPDGAWQTHPQPAQSRNALP